ncbi:MAG: ATP-binding protein [Candidatus Hydrothermarchaeaceae archaeon]
MILQTWQRKALLGAVGLLALVVIISSLNTSFQWINRPFPGFFLYGNMVVGPDFLPRWSGEKEGLRFMDRIVAVEGRAVHRRREIYDLVQSSPPNSSFHYTMERAGENISLTIPSMKFTFFDWFLTYGVYLLVGLSFLTIGIAPIYLRSSLPSVAPLFFMGSTVFLWFATTFDYMTTDIFLKDVRVFSFTLTPSAGIHLGLLLARGPDGFKRRRLYLYLIYGASILLGLFNSYSFYASVTIWQWALRLSYIYGWLASLIFLSLLWKAVRAPISNLERSRLRVILGGAFLGFLFPTFGTVIRSYYLLEVPHNLLLIFTVCFPLSVAFALLKYNLFDIDAVFKLGLQIILTGGLLLAYVLVVMILSISIGIYEEDYLFPILLSILVVLVFSPLMRWIEGVVSRYVYRRGYDPVMLQREVSSLLRTLSRPKSVAEKFLKVVKDRVGIKTGSVFCQSEEQGGKFSIYLNGYSMGSEEYPIELCSPWVEYFEALDRGISKDEVETNPVYRDNRDSLLKIFRELKLELLIPMIFEKKLLGLVSLGKKTSGGTYSADDFRILSNLTEQLALSLKNGILFEQSVRAGDEYMILYDRSEKMNKKLIGMDQQQKQFVANISHELRTPISTILGYTELLLDPEFNGERRIILERIVNGGRSVSGLMDSLLEFSRMESGTLSLGLEEVGVRELFGTLETMTVRLVKGSPIRLRWQIDPSISAIKTDPKKLQQILIHLLTNSVKFTERGEIALEVKPYWDNGYDFVEISVSDTGIGISKCDQEIIFEEFRQLDGSSTRKFGGTGLGLSLCKKLAQSLGGRIEVQSEVGHGSTFSLILPVKGSLESPAARLEGP